MFNHLHRARPVLKWAGGKSSLLQELISLFPGRFERYIEPFLGGASVYLAIAPGTKAIINDSNSDLMLTYKVIRDNPEQLMKQLDSYKKRYSETFYFQVRKSNPISAIERATRFIFLNKTCFNGLYRTNSKGLFNVSFGKRVKCPELYDLENMLSVSKRLSRAKIMNTDFAEVIASARKGDLIYCDPPYVPLSDTAYFSSYTPGGFTWSDQNRLRDACDQARKRGAQIFVSNSSAPVVRKLFTGWRLKTVHAPRCINSKGDRRGKIEELIAISLPYGSGSEELISRRAESVA